MLRLVSQRNLLYGVTIGTVVGVAY